MVPCTEYIRLNLLEGILLPRQVLVSNGRFAVALDDKASIRDVIFLTLALRIMRWVTNSGTASGLTANLNG